MDFFCIGVVVILIVWLGISNYDAKFAAADRLDRERAYRNALNRLAAKPEDNSLAIAALEAGRAHFGGLRRNGAPTVYDEAAINNDIAARRGTAVFPQKPN